MLPDIRFLWTARRAPAARKTPRRAVLSAEALEGRQLLSTFTVTNTADSGTGSLRWAITQVDNSHSGNNTINFKIPGSGVHTIALQSALPAITSPVTINGTSQSGYRNYPVIDLTGSSRSFDGFDIDCPHVTIEGFAIGGFDAGVSIQSSYDYVDYCFIGTDYTGRYAVPNNNGVVISPGYSYNTIYNDLISGNNDYGVWIQGNHNTVEDCYIGTDYTGRYALGNNIGVEIYWASYNTVESNLISANTAIGVQLDGFDLSFSHHTTGNVVAYNVIGTDPSGRYNLGNAEGVELYVVSGNSVVHNYIYYCSQGGVVETDYYHPTNTVAYNSFYHNYPGNIVPYPGNVPG
jgi:hypothetical protein